MPAGVTTRLVGCSVACLAGIAACSGSVARSTAPGSDGGVQADAGSRGVPLSGYASGSRLRARVLDGGGDPVRFEGFVDSKLGVRCDFAYAEDGVARCLPSGTAVSYFADAACSQPVIVVSAGCAAPPAYALWPTSGSASFCNWEPRLPAGAQKVLARDAPLGSVPTLYSPQGSSCAAASPQPSPGATVYAAHVLAPGTFVAAMEATDPRGARIGARVILADDGAAEVFGYFDETEHAACDVIQESIGWQSDLCIPTTMAWANQWADAACTQVAAHIGQQCPKPTIAVDASFMGNCWGKPTLHAYAIGAPIATSYTGSAGMCSTLAPDGEVTFATAGPIDLSTIPAVGIEPIGAAELRAYFRSSPDGVPILPDGLGMLPNSEGALFRDASRNADCWAMQLADGSWRCLPTAYALAGDTQYFSDSACTQEIVDAGDFSAPCPAPDPVVALRVPSPTCGTDVRVQGIYALGASMAGGSVYATARSGGPCSTASLPAGDRVYALGAPIDPATFPPISERTE